MFFSLLMSVLFSFLTLTYTLKWYNYIPTFSQYYIYSFFIIFSHFSFFNFSWFFFSSYLVLSSIPNFHLIFQYLNYFHLFVSLMSLHVCLCWYVVSYCFVLSNNHIYKYFFWSMFFIISWSSSVYIKFFHIFPFLLL